MLQPFNNHILLETGESSAIQVANLDNTWNDVPKGTVAAVPKEWVKMDDEFYLTTDPGSKERPFVADITMPHLGDKVLYKPGAHIVKFEQNGKDYVIIPLDAVIAVETDNE